jgi:hypothetical protein
VRVESSCSRVEDTLAKLKGIVKVRRLSEVEIESAKDFESQAEGKVLMGLCPGTNVGFREALAKKNVFVCLTDEKLVWPSCSYLKLLCGDEIIGQDIYDEAELQRRKEEGNMVAGNLVFYREKMGILRERRSDLRVLMLPMEIKELCACGAVVGSPSPPTDLYLKRLLDADMENRHLGTIVVGVG